jgi:hypothetical protein
MSKYADQIIDLYERHASDFDSDRRSEPWLDKPWLDRFVSLLPERSSAVAHVVEDPSAGGRTVWLARSVRHAPRTYAPS